jgi:hypothetical protein
MLVFNAYLLLLALAAATWLYDIVATRHRPIR